MIRLLHLTKRYGKFTAVDNIDLVIPTGQLFGFLGVLVALPASAVLFVAFRRLRAGYMGSNLYHSRDARRDA